VQKHSRRLETLIEDLLSISALESQQARLAMTKVNLPAAIEAAIEELRQQAREKSISVHTNVSRDTPPTTADSQRLHQVLINLLDNAVKYTQAGGRVTVSACATDQEVEICVADNGPGITAEHLPHIFERFYRVDKARSRELGGTGLGLSIVKHIVQAHNGRVWAESTPGQGSRFYFTLPRA
jgi:two-component system phosphate regulon sensor histidine kinase PhoR